MTGHFDDDPNEYIASTKDADFAFGATQRYTVSHRQCVTFNLFDITISVDDDDFLRRPAQASAGHSDSSRMKTSYRHFRSSSTRSVFHLCNEALAADKGDRICD